MENDPQSSIPFRAPQVAQQDASGVNPAVPKGAQPLVHVEELLYNIVILSILRSLNGRISMRFMELNFNSPQTLVARLIWQAF